MIRAYAAALGCAAALGLVACGGAEQPKVGARPAPGTAHNPLVAEVTDENSGIRSLESTSEPGESAEKSGRVPGTPEAANGTTPGYGSLLEQQKRHPDSRFTPCNLVSLKEATAIIGAKLEPPVEAPQGPTCIYQSRDGKHFVSISVEDGSYARMKRLLRKPSQVTTARGTGVCGESKLYVPLAGGRVLSIGGPCAIARQLALKAAPRVPKLAS